ncbi:MAG: hypothetical protein EP330_19765 [Deltaproteobacteria bacterium]|nr:MAG: hypothetical protein EP330_19765 [Deltaproteobacteria bacterium]
MLALFRRKPAELDPHIIHYVLSLHLETLDVHERAALYAARVSHDSPRDGTHGARVLQIWEETATPDAIDMVGQGLEHTERELANRVVERLGRQLRLTRCRSCDRVHAAHRYRCSCGGKLAVLSLR